MAVPMTVSINASRLLAVLSAMLAAGCASPDPAVEQSEEFLALGDYYRAYKVLEDLGPEAAERDPEVAAQLDKVRIPYLLETGQQLVFENRDVEALARFGQVLVWDPDNRIARRWIDKCHDKLARKSVERGNAALSRDDLEAALIAYDEAMQHVPDQAAAVEGVKRVAERTAERQERAAAHYIAGVRRLAEQLFGQSYYHLFNAILNDPTLERARDRQELVEHRLAERIFDRAEKLRAEGHYGAALADYREVVRLEPEYPQARERIEEMERERDAEALARAGEMAMFRGDFDTAREKLREARALTRLEEAFVIALLNRAEERALEQRYHKARDLQLEFRYDEALAAYRAIEEQWAGFLDVRTRIDLLERDLEIAEETYEQGRAAEAKGDVAAAIQAYDDLQAMLPRYADSHERLQRLRGKTGEGGDTEGGDPGDGDPESGGGGRKAGDPGDGDPEVGGAASRPSGAPAGRDR